MPPPPARPVPDLINDAIAEILLRIPPDEPAHLFAAALVCKPWLRILTDPSFLSRYRKLHRAPPLLGYLYNPFSGPVPMPVFVPTTPASPLNMPAHDRRMCRVMDCRHGRVLMRKNFGRSERLVVWDPITGDQKKLSQPKMYPLACNTGAAVLCAVDGCDHLNCHAGAFRVVCCGTGQHIIWVIMYSSETREWRSMINADVDVDFYLSCTTLIGNALYFKLDRVLGSMLKYDLGRNELSMISSPNVSRAYAMELDDGDLGFVGVLDNCVYTWSWQDDATNNSIGTWAQHMVTELDKVLPIIGAPHFPHDVIGVVEGTDTIFINMEEGLFTLNLKSRKVKKMGETVCCPWIIPYMNFYAPDCGRFSSLVLPRLAMPDAPLKSKTL